MVDKFLNKSYGPRVKAAVISPNFGLVCIMVQKLGLVIFIWIYTIGNQIFTFQHLLDFAQRRALIISLFTLHQTKRNRKYRPQSLAVIQKKTF